MQGFAVRAARGICGEDQGLALDMIRLRSTSCSTRWSTSCSRTPTNWAETTPTVVKTSRLSEYPLDTWQPSRLPLAKFRASSCAGIDAANALGDADTADLSPISRGVDKLLWKVEAHAQAQD